MSCDGSTRSLSLRFGSEVVVICLMMYGWFAGRPGIQWFLLLLHPFLMAHGVRPTRATQVADTLEIFPRAGELSRLFGAFDVNRYIQLELTYPLPAGALLSRWFFSFLPRWRDVSFVGVSLGGSCWDVGMTGMTLDKMEASKSWRYLDLFFPFPKLIISRCQVVFLRVFKLACSPKCQS